MVERAGLENRNRCKPIVGSNPTSSAAETHENAGNRVPAAVSGVSPARRDRVARAVEGLDRRPAVKGLGNTPAVGPAGRSARGLAPREPAGRFVGRGDRPAGLPPCGRPRGVME